MILIVGGCVGFRNGAVGGVVEYCELGRLYAPWLWYWIDSACWFLGDLRK